MVVIDVGAAYDHYAADITRTVPVGKDMSRRQSQVFNAVVEVQTYAYEQLRPGVRIKEYENAVEHFMGEKLRELGLIKTIDSEQVRKYYPHATSHHLGLNVHDVADYERPLEAGMVITVEPGIYIPEESLGVRIEDDVVITDTAIDIITSGLPTQLS
jgi:Xaa-Pro aminopeptidase